MGSLTPRRTALIRSTNLIILGTLCVLIPFLFALYLLIRVFSGVLLLLFVVSGALAYGARFGLVWFNGIAEWFTWYTLSASCLTQTLAFNIRRPSEDSSESAHTSSTLQKGSRSGKSDARIDTSHPSNALVV